MVSKKKQQQRISQRPITTINLYVLKLEANSRKRTVILGRGHYSCVCWKQLACSWWKHYSGYVKIDWKDPFLSLELGCLRGSSILTDVLFGEKSE